MSKPATKPSALAFRPVNSERWQDFEQLFGPKGACAGCWCMWFRLKRSQWEEQQGDENRRAMKTIVDSGQVPGILAYENGAPVGWCSVAPRGQFSALSRSPILRPIDEQPVWSIVCIFLTKSMRRKGLALSMVQAALEHAKEHGAQLVEAYPIDTPKKNYPTAFAPTGFYSTFVRAGFKESARRSPTRPIMRYSLEGK